MRSFNHCSFNFFLLVVLFLLSANKMSAFTVEHDSLLQEGKVWYYTINDTGDSVGIMAHIKYWISGDSVVDGITYKRLYYDEKSRMYQDDDDREFRYHYNDVFCVRQSGNQILLRQKESNAESKEMLVYNLDFNPADTVKWQWYLPHAARIDTILVRGKYYKRAYFTSVWEHVKDYMFYFIDGIGTSYQPMYFPHACECDSVCLNGKCIFKYADFYAKPINTTPTGITAVGRKRQQAAIYTLSGIRVSSPQKGQIYIKDRKKFIAR